MNICVQGLWHLGSVTCACLSAAGHTVIGLDTNSEAIENLNLGKAPLFEPGLDELLRKGIANGRLRFVNSLEGVDFQADLLWVTYDTPVDDDDIADIDYVIDSVKAVLPHMRDDSVILFSSQLPVGSVAKLEKWSKSSIPEKQFHFACSPENLRLGKALEVFQSPDRIIVGVRDLQAREVIGRTLSPITSKIEWMSVESAEMTKHAINSFLATSVTFANEIAAVCELVGADAKEVERGLKTESRIGPKAYLSPGGPFAGGTLARDIEFLGGISREKNLRTPLLSSVRKSNDEHKNWVKRKLIDRFKSLAGQKVAVWGLTYKPGTDTLRRSLAIELCEWLINEQALVSVFDPVVKKLPDEWGNKVEHHVSAMSAVKDADVLVIGTEWPEFKEDAKFLGELMKSGLLVIDSNRHLNAALSLEPNNYFAVGSIGAKSKL